MEIPSNAKTSEIHDRQSQDDITLIDSLIRLKSVVHIDNMKMLKRLLPSNSDPRTIPQLPGTELVTIRARNPLESTIDRVYDETIPKQVAVCKFCFKMFEEEEYQNKVLKTKCKCNFSLTHTECAIEWPRNKGFDNKCEVCGQDTQYIPVTLSSASTPKATKTLSSNAEIASNLKTSAKTFLNAEIASTPKATKQRLFWHSKGGCSWRCCASCFSKQG